MLPNPVVVPVYACPITWTVVSLAMSAEVVTEQALLRRLGVAIRASHLALLNLFTWLPFLVAMQHCSRAGLRGGGMAGAIATLEVAVVLGEAVLLRRLVAESSGAPLRAQRFGSMLRVSLLGNLVSVAASMGLPAAIVLALP